MGELDLISWIPPWVHSGDLAGYVVLPSDFSTQIQQSRLVAPQVHLEGSQPGLSGSILQAVSQSFTALAGTAGVRFAPKVTYLYGGPDFDTLDVPATTLAKIRELVK